MSHSHLQTLVQESFKPPCAKKITRKNASTPAVAESLAAECLAVHKLAMACPLSCLGVQCCATSDILHHWISSSKTLVCPFKLHAIHGMHKCLSTCMHCSSVRSASSRGQNSCAPGAGLSVCARYPDASGRGAHASCHSATAGKAS